MSLLSAVRLAADPCALMTRAGLTPDSWQRRLLNDQPHRALVVTSRQAGKSTSTAALALHRAITRSGTLIVLVSPSQRQSTELLLKVATFTDHTPEIAVERRSAMRLHLVNGSRVEALPGNSSAVRGYSSAGLIVADEAGWIPDDVFTAISPILAASGGDLMLLSTPNGKQGWLYDQWAHGSDAWTRVAVPHTEITRLDAGQVAFDRATMGTRFVQEYECEFLAPRGALFDVDSIEVATSPADAPDMPNPHDIVKRAYARARADHQQQGEGYAA